MTSARPGVPLPGAGLRQLAPFGGAGVLGFVTVFFPPRMSADVLWGAGAIIAWCAAFAVLFGWARPPRRFSVALPLAYLVALGIMMNSQGGGTSPLAPMIVVAVFWVALYGTRWQLSIMIAGSAAMSAALLIQDHGAVAPGEWRSPVLWVVVLVLVGFSTQAMVMRSRGEAEQRAEERDFVDAVIGHAGALVIVLDVSARIVRFNPAAERATGIASAEAIGRTLWELGLLPDQDVEPLRPVFHPAAQDRNPSDDETVWIACDGTRRLHLWSNTVITDAHGDVSHVIRTAIDVTAQREAEAALRAAEDRVEAAARALEARFIDAFHHAPVGMGLVSLDGHFLSVNRALGEITGYMPDQLESMSPHAISHPEDHLRDLDLRRSILEGEIDHYDIEMRYVHSLGHPVDVSMHVTLAHDIDGRPTNFVTQVIDITERKRFEDQLQHMADHDPLTGMLNRRRFKQELDRHVAQVQRYGAEGAVLVLDVDHFKQINDTMGHQAGDQLIISVAQVLRSNLRATDVLARLGGDEFAILLPKADRAEAQVVARKLVTAVRNCASVLNGHRARSVTISLGVTMCDVRNAITGDDVIVDADMAMYDAKNAGRDRFAFFATDADAAPPTRARAALLEPLEIAVDVARRPS